MQRIAIACTTTYRAFYGDAVEDIAAFAAGAPIRVLTP